KTYFSYDAHGNIAWLARELPGLGRKFVRYEYDLISGKVLKVIYNEGQPDQFFHQYVYDADNRLRELRTSRDGKFWERDLTVGLLPDGRIRRLELGEDKLQGLDYVYGVSMNLKAVNHPELDPTRDPGRDGKGNGFARDVFGMQLNRYPGDYAHASHSMLPDLEAQNELYGGKVTEQISRVRGAGLGAPALGQAYRYDEAGRLVSANSYSAISAGFVPTDDFKTEFSYDGNGNLLSLNRNATRQALPATNGSMDRLQYHYQNVAGRPSNRLDYIQDAVSTPAADFDLDSQSPGNYSYDVSGRLLRDNAAGITEIDWNHRDLIDTYSRDDGLKISLKYGPDGHREQQALKGGGNERRNTHYVRGAGGEVLAIYESTRASETAQQVEIPLHAGHRIGLYKPSAEFAEDETGALPEGLQARRYRRVLDHRQYEIKDHLNNVRAVIGDAKHPIAQGNFEVKTL
ncbi:MAG: hypothetical protein AAF570_24415, partial [Bacteroidota bacterium]